MVSAVGIPGLNGSPSLIMDGPSLTMRQKQVVMAISVLMAEKGRPPSLAELGRFLGITKNGARLHVRRLIRKGIVRPLAGSYTTMLVQPPIFREVWLK